MVVSGSVEPRKADGGGKVQPVIRRASAPAFGKTRRSRSSRPCHRVANLSWTGREKAWKDVVLGLRTAIDDLRKTPVPAPREKELKEPRYADDESRHLSVRLKDLFQRRKELTIDGGDTRELQGEILDVRRLLRKGPQLRAGEFLGDGRYELLEVVGQGGFATVWKGWDEEGDRLVALKVLHGHFAEDRGRRARFFRGARLMAELAHPRIVKVLESEQSDDGWRFFVMEYVPGGSFEQAVLVGGLTPEQRLAVVLQVGEALEHAHRRGAVHRDVKPSNVLLDAEGHAKLSDFDLVRADDTTGLTATRAMMGTVQFAAPEALESAKDVGPAADVYSLGATAVFALLGGRLPPWFYRDPGRAIAELGGREELKQVLERATAFEVGQRFVSVAEFCRALAMAAQPEPPRIPAITAPPGPGACARLSGTGTGPGTGSGSSGSGSSSRQGRWSDSQ